jgi:organic radical activating enzyme
MYFHWPVVFSRGCPHPCEYCAVQTYYQRSFRTRPVEGFIDEIRRMKALGARRFLFLDDNPIAHPEKAKEMLAALVKERVQWVSQATINVARDPELLDLVARLLRAVDRLQASRTRASPRSQQFNRPTRFAEDIAKLRKGIQVIALVMVSTRPLETFPTRPLARRQQISFLKPSRPRPTRHEVPPRHALAGRLLSNDWGNYDCWANRPPNMTPTR